MTDSPRSSMRLKVFLPTRVLIDQAVTKIRADSACGNFCVLPRHTDAVTALVPGLLEYTTPAANTFWVAMDEGVLVKCGGLVSVCAINGVCGDNLDNLREQVEGQLRELDEQEKVARRVLAQLEATALRQLWNLQEAERV